MSVNTEPPVSKSRNSPEQSTYRGRFAPTPSGPLHFGSVIAALGSYLQAKSRNGKWLLRIENIDTPRNEAGAVESILRTLENFALYWDEEIIFQHQRIDIYQDILSQLQQHKHVYPCVCSRADTKGMPYPGICRNGHPPVNRSSAYRLRTTANTVTVHDHVQGMYQQCLEQDVGDFILCRSDGIIAYHLAVVVDDYAQGITEIVRGTDLLESTPRQVYLQQLLNFPTPSYCHLPVAVNEDGTKISKQNHAPGVDNEAHTRILYQALEFLGQTPETDLLDATPAELLSWAIAHWSIDKVPRQAAIRPSV